MALPIGNKQWPPQQWENAYRLYAELSAWYSGDPNQLAEIYSQIAFSPTPRGRFWARETREERRVMLHVPIAGDIAAASADLLFSEPPKVKIPEAHTENAAADAKQAQERLNEIIQQGNMFATLLEAAETCAAMGGVFLKVNWDTELAAYPLLSVAQADCALPEFRQGFLSAVTLWKVLEIDNSTVWRFLERHEPGIIEYGLYRGTDSALGQQVALQTRMDTADLPDAVQTGLKGLAVRYVPNMRPNRRNRASMLGQSDYSGSEGLMDALDEVYTSWMRDVRLGQGRIIVPEMFLEKSEKGFAFDPDREVFTTMNVDPLSNVGINVSQFAIRAAEHQQTALELLDRIVSNAGYSPQTFGLKLEGRAESGTALNIRERKTFVTAAKKATYWKTALDDIFQIMLEIDASQLHSGVTAFRPNVEIQDSVPSDYIQLAQTAQALAAAEAASIETRVRMMHTDWEEEQIKAEVQRIMDESGRSQQVQEPENSPRLNLAGE